MVFDVTRRQFLLVNATASIAVLTQRHIGQQLTGGELRTLRTVAETLFPMGHRHEELYQQAVAAVRRRCRFDRDAFDAVTAGLASLEWTCGGRFAASSARVRVSVLKSMESSHFFMVVYGEFLEQLFAHASFWPLFTPATTG